MGVWGEQRASSLAAPGANVPIPGASPGCPLLPRSCPRPAWPRVLGCCARPEQQPHALGLESVGPDTARAAQGAPCPSAGAVLGFGHRVLGVRAARALPEAAAAAHQLRRWSVPSWAASFHSLPCAQKVGTHCLAPSSCTGYGAGAASAEPQLSYRSRVCVCAECRGSSTPTAGRGGHGAVGTGPRGAPGANPASHPQTSGARRTRRGCSASTPTALTGGGRPR